MLDDPQATQGPGRVGAASTGSARTSRTTGSPTQRQRPSAVAGSTGRPAADTPRAPSPRGCRTGAVLLRRCTSRARRWSTTSTRVSTDRPARQLPALRTGPGTRVRPRACQRAAGHEPRVHRPSPGPARNAARGRLTLEQIIDLLDVDGYQETFVRRSQIPRLSARAFRRHQLADGRADRRPVADRAGDSSTATPAIWSAALVPGSVQCDRDVVPLLGNADLREHPPGQVGRRRALRVRLRADAGRVHPPHHRAALPPEAGAEPQTARCGGTSGHLQHAHADPRQRP